MKDCLIIPCSDKKYNQKSRAIDLYQGVLLDIIRTSKISNVALNFEIFFLSAKYGLVHSNTILSPYDMKLSSEESKLIEYAGKYAKASNDLLSLYAHKDVRLFTVLSKDYQRAFDLMGLKCLKSFNMVYYSRKSRGIGDHRSRLKKIINNVPHPLTEPTLFRSGCSNTSEMIAFLQSNEAVGTSLAYLSKNNLLQYTIDAIKLNNRVFIDNGMITAHTKQQTLNHDKIFSQYISLVNNIRGPKNLSIVIPDDPLSQSNSLATITKFKKEIRNLARKCRVIIVFHHPIERTVVEQAKLVIKILGKVDITLGIPCRNIKNNNWRLSTTDIESLFSLTDSNNKVFNKVHFLALSEKTKGKVYQERLALANMYNMEFSADSCRMQALFGNNKTSLRAGSVAEREATKEITKHNTLRDLNFVNYDAESEIDSTELWDRIHYLTPQEKASLWNKCFPHVKIEEENDDDALEVFENLTNAYFHDFVPKAKYILYSTFTMPNHKPKHSQKRSEAIIKCFNKGTRVAVQQVMNI